MKSGKILGFVIILIAVAVAYWAYTHSSHSGLKGAVSDLFSGSIRFSNNEFYAVISACGLVALYGLFRVIKK